MFRKVELFQLKQVWSNSFGTSTGDLDTLRGSVLTIDNNFNIVPFNPMANSDYVPNAANNYIGLINVATSTGAVSWVNVYTPSVQFAMTPVDGGNSPDNNR